MGAGQSIRVDGMNSNRALDSLAASYRQQGYCFPVARLPRSTISAVARRVDALLASPAAGLEPPWNTRAPLLVDWIYDLTVHPLVLDAAEAVIGPNILMQAADVFAKPGHSRMYVNWHQDGNYWNLDPFELCTAGIALTDVFPENGCMRCLPGTHCNKARAHGNLRCKQRAHARPGTRARH